MKPSQLAKNLRAIAAYIENTPRPSRVKVASALKSLVRTAAEGEGHTESIFTTYSDMAQANGWDGSNGHTKSEILSHLKADPENAVTMMVSGNPVAVFQNGGSAFVQEFPLSDPNDADGPMTLEEAVSMATGV